MKVEKIFLVLAMSLSANLLVAGPMVWNGEKRWRYQLEDERPFPEVKRIPSVDSVKAVDTTDSSSIGIDEIHLKVIEKELKSRLRHVLVEQVKETELLSKLFSGNEKVIHIDNGSGKSLVRLGSHSADDVSLDSPSADSLQESVASSMGASQEDIYPVYTIIRKSESDGRLSIDTHFIANNEEIGHKEVPSGVRFAEVNPLIEDLTNYAALVAQVEAASKGTK